MRASGVSPQRAQVLESLAQMPKDVPTQTAAKAIYAEHPTLFASLTAAYSVVRRVRGETCDRSIAVPGHARTSEARRAAHAWNRLPKPAQSAFKVHDLPKYVKKWLILADAHIPYFDEHALKSAIEHGYDEGCDGVMLLGDWLDCYAESRWERDPRERSLDAEIEMAGQVLDVIQATLQPSAFYWKFGNHERRHEHYILSHAPALGHLFEKFVGLDKLLECEKRGIVTIDEWSFARIDELYLAHGHEVGQVMANPVSPARGMYLRAGTYMICGHGHQTSSHTKTVFMGEDITTWSVGCLSDLHPKYRPINPYNHGFATIDCTDSWQVENWRISSRGKVVRA